MVQNIHISKYKYDTSQEYNPNRDKKLLLNKNEIKKIIKSINEKGMSLIPIKLFVNEKGMAKVELGLGKGKKLFDKEDLKKKDVDKQIQRIKKGKLVPLILLSSDYTLKIKIHSYIASSTL